LGFRGGALAGLITGFGTLGLWDLLGLAGFGLLGVDRFGGITIVFLLLIDIF